MSAKSYVKMSINIPVVYSFYTLLLREKTTVMSVVTSTDNRNRIHSLCKN